MTKSNSLGHKRLDALRSVKKFPSTNRTTRFRRGRDRHAPHIGTARAPSVRTSKVGLVVKEPATAGIDCEIWFGERGSPPTEAANFGRRLGRHPVKTPESVVLT